MLLLCQVPVISMQRSIATMNKRFQLATSYSHRRQTPQGSLSIRFIEMADFNRPRQRDKIRRKFQLDPDIELEFR